MRTSPFTRAIAVASVACTFTAGTRSASTTCSTPVSPSDGSTRWM